VDAGLRSAVEERTDVDLGDVHIHSGTAAAGAADRRGARALTVGRHVLLGSGEGTDGSSSAQRLIAHELAHVAQRRRAQSVRRGWSAPGDGFERHAAAVAESVISDGRAPSAQPPGAAPALSRQERPDARGTVGAPKTASPTDADAVVALAGLRRSDPTGFVDFVVKNEFAVYRLLSPFGFHGSWVKNEAYLEDFDRAFTRWVQSGKSPSLLAPLLFAIVEQEDDTDILAALPDGTGYIGTRRGFRAAAQRQYAERSLKTLSNITGGLFGAVGYMARGDKGSDLGAAVDGVVASLGSAAQQRQQMRDVGVSLGPRRDVAAEVRSAAPTQRAPGGPLKPPSVSVSPSPSAPFRPENAPRPVVQASPGAPPITVPQASAPAAPTSPEVTPAAAAPSPQPVPPTASPLKVASSPQGASPMSTPSGVSKQAPPAFGGATTTAPSWKETWNPLVQEAERPAARQSDRGFRTQTAVSPDGRTRVVITEGVVGLQVTGKSTADYGTRLPGEHSTHPVGRQSGEDVGPSAQASAPARLNLSELKTFENTLRTVADRAAEQGGTVETRTVMVSEVRNVGGQEVQVLVGVRRTAALRLPGRAPVTFMHLEAVVDPQTRAVTVLLNTTP